MSKTEHQITDDADLEAFFVAARVQAPDPGPDLMSRVLADAHAEIAARSAPARPAPRRRGMVEALLAALGGWPAVAGMVTATLASVWFGFAAPDQVNTLAGGLLWTDATTDAATGYTLDDLLPGSTGFDSILEETGA